MKINKIIFNLNSKVNKSYSCNSSERDKVKDIVMKYLADECDDYILRMSKVFKEYRNNLSEKLGDSKITSGSKFEFISDERSFVKYLKDKTDLEYSEISKLTRDVFKPYMEELFKLEERFKENKNLYKSKARELVDKKYGNGFFDTYYSKSFDRDFDDIVKITNLWA